jgi:hypothetical protein
MRKLTSALLLCFFVLAVQGYSKDRVLNTQVLHATYVALGYETAQGFISEFDEQAFISAKILPADRQSLGNVHDALAKWKRYTVTAEPRDAELLIAVRSGRLAAVNGGVLIGNVPGVTRGPGGVAPVFGAEAGPPHDYLAVYAANKGREGARLWVKSEDDGLVGTNPPLFVDFKDDVEALAKKYPKH